MTIRYKCRYCHVSLFSKHGAQYHRCSTMPEFESAVTPDNAFVISATGIEPFASSVDSQATQETSDDGHC